VNDGAGELGETCDCEGERVDKTLIERKYLYRTRAFSDRKKRLR
jgi:hypothetical protein